MGGYVFGIVSSAVISFLIITLSPDSEGGEIGRYLGFMGALFVMLSIVLPLSDSLKEEYLLLDMGISEAEQVQDEELTGEYYASLAAEALSRIYGTAREDILARVFTDDSGGMEAMELIVPKGAGYDLADAGAVVSKICGMEISVKEGG